MNTTKDLIASEKFKKMNSAEQIDALLAQSTIDIERDGKALDKKAVQVRKALETAVSNDKSKLTPGVKCDLLLAAEMQKRKSKTVLGVIKVIVVVIALIAITNFFGSPNGEVEPHFGIRNVNTDRY